MTDLEFQEIPYDGPKESEPAHVNISMTDADEHLVEYNESQDDGMKEAVKPSVFSLPFYQQFFNVDAGDVFTRTWSSMVPNPRRNYLEYSIRPNPDLYGPFWICATLTFFIAIAGNVADFFSKSGEGFLWRYDFHKVTLAATVIFTYWLIIPLSIWAFLRWRGNKAGFTLTEIVCVYGYSLAIFIPVSVLWLVPVLWVKYLLATIASLLSGCTLLITLWPAVKNDVKQVAIVFVVLVMLLHAALGTGFVLYFFHYESSIASTPASNVSNLPTAHPNQQLLQNPARSFSESKSSSQTNGKVSLSDGENTDGKDASPDGENTDGKDASPDGENTDGKDASPGGGGADSKRLSPGGGDTDSKRSSPGGGDADSKRSSPGGGDTDSKRSSPGGGDTDSVANPGSDDTDIGPAKVLRRRASFRKHGGPSERTI